MSTSNLKTMLKERIASGLKRKSVTCCSRWAKQYRVMGAPFPGLWSDKHHPWTNGMMDCEEEMTVGQKAAQMAFTEVGLNRVFYALDMHGQSCLYVLPAATPDAADFSASRFDPALELSPHLNNMFSDVKNIKHKRAGNANLFIRGSRSRRGLKSLPVSHIVFDEVEEMVQDNVVLALERTAGQLEKSFYLLSTPSLPDKGINKFFKKSTQDHFYFKCIHCGHQIELTYPDCLVITADDPDDRAIMDSYIVCPRPQCKGILPHDQKEYYLKDGVWVPTNSNMMARGFYINQLYSPTTKPYEIATFVLRAEKNPAYEQELYNSKLGLPHIVSSILLTDSHIEQCIGNHKSVEELTSPNPITMGVDVGTKLHVEIDEWYSEPNNTSIDPNDNAVPVVRLETTVDDFHELDVLVAKYGVNYVVIDAQPEERMSKSFCERFCGMARRCHYGNSVSGKLIIDKGDEIGMVTVDRTSWMDVALQRFHKTRIRLPYDLSEEYKGHVKTPVRVYRLDSDGNSVGKYDSRENPDHFAHARTYAEIAYTLLMAQAGVHTINEV